MKQLILFLLLSIGYQNLYSQGYGYALFSSTGDTVLIRTSFGRMSKPDTVSTYFNVLRKGKQNTELLSVFSIHEKDDPKHSEGYACANFSSISEDTLNKYNLVHEGEQLKPNAIPIKIKTKKLSTTDTLIGNVKYSIRLVEYSFLLNKTVFLKEHIREVIKSRKKKIEKPRISKVFYNVPLNKYFIKYFIKDSYFDPKKNRVVQRFIRKSIIP